MGAVHNDLVSKLDFIGRRRSHSWAVLTVFLTLILMLVGAGAGALLQERHMNFSALQTSDLGRAPGASILQELVQLDPNVAKRIFDTCQRGSPSVSFNEGNVVCTVDLRIGGASGQLSSFTLSEFAYAVWSFIPGVHLAFLTLGVIAGGLVGFVFRRPAKQ